MQLYKLFWDEFSSWYLEIIKPAYQQPIDSKTYQITLGFFDALLRLLHPFMPFITEELWQALEEREAGDRYHDRSTTKDQRDRYHTAERYGTGKTDHCRGTYHPAGKNIPQKEKLELQIVGGDRDKYSSVISKMCNLSSFSSVSKSRPEPPDLGWAPRSIPFR